jgi:hypothetical protein
MKIFEFRDLDEVGYVPQKARSYLQGRRGFTQLGTGSDQFAYQMRRGNWVLKIFGGQKDAEDHPELTPSQAMYLHWVQYCVNNMAKNKFLPRFRKTHGRYWHYRKLDGRLLIVTIQETLLRGSRSIDLARFCDLLQKERELVLGIIKGGIDPADPTSTWTIGLAE